MKQWNGSFLLQFRIRRSRSKRETEKMAISKFINVSFFCPFPIWFLCWQVSWIRKRDLHILTVGILTYTNDQRFQAMHQEGSDEWTLKITSPQPRDSGTYECQVSMEPKISQAFRLVVIGEYPWNVNEKPNTQNTHIFVLKNEILLFSKKFNFSLFNVTSCFIWFFFLAPDVLTQFSNSRSILINGCVKNFAVLCIAKWNINVCLPLLACKCGKYLIDPLCRFLYGRLERDFSKII